MLPMINQRFLVVDKNGRNNFSVRRAECGCYLRFWIGCEPHLFSYHGRSLLVSLFPSQKCRLESPFLVFLLVRSGGRSCVQIVGYEFRKPDDRENFVSGVDTPSSEKSAPDDFPVLTVDKKRVRWKRRSVRVGKKAISFLFLRSQLRFQDRGNTKSRFQTDAHGRKTTAKEKKERYVLFPFLERAFFSTGLQIHTKIACDPRPTI